MRHAVDQVSVVGQQHEAGAFEVEPPRGHEPRRSLGLRYEVEDRGAAAVVAHGREVAERLVQQQVDRRRRRGPDRLAVHLDPVARAHGQRDALGVLAVDADLAGNHELHDVSPRAGAGRDQVLDQRRIGSRLVGFALRYICHAPSYHARPPSERPAAPC